MTGAGNADNSEGETGGARPSPSPWAGARPAGSGVELPSDRTAAYQPPGRYEQPAAWDGPSAYQSATETGAPPAGEPVSEHPEGAPDRSRPP
ncbi:MAG: hypothetical protein M3Y91_15720, partial [Actinomycetota bacterium]|nr:hypothetical protein [Actinomycetota bacterium]